MGILIREVNNHTRVIAWVDENGSSLTHLIARMINDQGKARVLFENRQLNQPITRIDAQEQACWMLQLQTNPVVCINFTHCDQAHSESIDLICKSFSRLSSACHFLLSPLDARGEL